MGLRDFRGREPFGGLNSPTWAWGDTRLPPGFRAVRTGIVIYGITVLAVLVILVGCVFAALVEDTGGANGRHTVYITAVEDVDNLFWDATLVYAYYCTLCRHMFDIPLAGLGPTPDWEDVS